jgi:hypothetical protein
MAIVPNVWGAMPCLSAVMTFADIPIFEIVITLTVDPLCSVMTSALIGLADAGLVHPVNPSDVTTSSDEGSAMRRQHRLNVRPVMVMAVLDFKLLSEFI